jgi:hypothetical protein
MGYAALLRPGTMLSMRSYMPLLVAAGVIGYLLNQPRRPHKHAPILKHIGIPEEEFIQLKQPNQWSCVATSIAMACRPSGVIIDPHVELEWPARHGGLDGQAIADYLARIQVDALGFHPHPVVVKGWRKIVPSLMAAFSRREPVILGLRDPRLIWHAVVAFGGEVDEHGVLHHVFLADPSPQPYWPKPPTMGQLAVAVHEAVYLWDPTL